VRFPNGACNPAWKENMTTSASATLPFPNSRGEPASSARRVPSREGSGTLSGFPNTKARRPLVPEINVTPLVDVVLVLLIIFMVIAPQLEAGERVELPSLINVAKAAKLDITTVTITASGRLLLEKDVKTLDALKADLRSLHEKEPERRVVIKSDRGVKYGKVREMFAMTQDIGFPGVALMVDERKDKGKASN
jgi:biopolymer transport protein TolR